MAQLKDSVVSGNLRVTDTTLTDTLQVTTIKAPTSSGGTTYGPGTSGQVLKSNGTSVYWTSDNNANYYHKTGTWNGLTYTAAKVGSPEDLAFTIPTGNTASTVALGNHTHDYLPLAGGTMTGVLTLKGEQYNNNYAMDCNNSNIIHINALRFNDNSESYTEGISFPRITSGYWDTIWAKGGEFYFTPNHETDVTGATSYKVLHTNNTSFSSSLSSGTKIGTITIAGTATDIYCQTNTDTKVTSAANHYTPATASGSDKTASASGATAAWGINVVKGVTLNTDGKGHVTGISVTSGKIPGNPVPSNAKFTDENVKQTPTTSSNTSYRPVLVGMDYGDPGYTATEKTDAVYTVPRVMIKPSTGDLVLYSGGDADSPSLTFQRGTQSDGTYDWKLYVTGGHLNFNRNNAGTWTNLVQFEKTGKLYVSGSIYSNNTPVSLDGHKHGLLHSDLNQASTNGTTGGWSVIGIDPAVTGYVLKSIRVNTTSPNWLSGDYGAGIAFGGSDTKGVISMSYQSPPVITFAGGNHNSSKTEPTWYLKISGTSGSTYNLANFYDSTISRTANTVLAAPNGSNGGATFRKLVAADLTGINYAGSSSVGGPATSVATEVGSAAGARPVFYAYLGDNTRVVYNTNFTYNPSGNVLTATKFVGALDGTASQAIKLRSSAARTDSTVDTADTTPYQKYWVKIASCYATKNYTDLESLWAVNDVYGNRQGILKVRARVEDTAGTFGNTRTIRWIVADNNIDVNRFAIVCYNNRKPDGTTASGTATVELWWKSTGQYDSFSFVLLDETRRTGKQPNDWVLYDTSTYGQAALPTTGNITYSVAATILNSTTGTSSNVTGTVAIAHGGTGATTRLAALRALTEQDVGTSAQYFLTITNSWGKGGYTSVANVKTVLGLKSAAYTESTSYIPMSGSMGVTGNIEITKASGDVGFYAKRSDTGVEVWMGVGSGGTNHGIYSNKLGKWMMYGDATNVYLNGNAATATKLATAQNINGVSFDGSANITIPRSIKHIHTANGTDGSGGWVKIASITVTEAYADQPMTFTIAQRSIMQYRIHLLFTNSGSVANTAISEFIITRDNSWTDTNNDPRAYIIKPSDGIFDLYIRKTKSWDRIFVVDFTKADDGGGNSYSITWKNVHVADSAITGGTEAVKKLYLPTSGGTVNGAITATTFTGNTFKAGKPKTADGAAKGQVKFFSGNANDTTGTVTLECVNDSARTGDYTVKLPTWNGTIPVFEKLFEGASNNVSLSFSDINEYDLFLITVANSNATTEQVTVTSLWISNVVGVHDMPLIWGGTPSSSGGACNVTSGWIQLSKSSGTTTFSVAHKSNVAQMTSSGWTISSPTYKLYIRKIFGLKAYKRT